MGSIAIVGPSFAMRGDPWSKGFGKGGLPKGFGKGFGKGRRNGGWRRSSPGKWRKIEGEKWGLTKELCTSAKEETSNTVDPWGGCQCDPLQPRRIMQQTPTFGSSHVKTSVCLKVGYCTPKSSCEASCGIQTLPFDASCLLYLQHFQRDPPLFRVWIFRVFSSSQRQVELEVVALEGPRVRGTGDAGKQWTNHGPKGWAWYYHDADIKNNNNMLKSVDNVR